MFTNDELEESFALAETLRHTKISAQAARSHIADRLVELTKLAQRVNNLVDYLNLDKFKGDHELSQYVNVKDIFSRLEN